MARPRFSEAEAQRRAAEQEARRNAALEKLRHLGATAEELEQQDSIAPLTLLEQRVDHILKMMCDGAWVIGQSDRALAGVWKLEASVIRRYAAEANRLLRRFMRDDEPARREALAECLQSFDRLAQKAEAVGTPNGLRVAHDLKVSKLVFLGLKPAQKHVFKTETMADWSDDQLKHYIATGERPEGKE